MIILDIVTLPKNNADLHTNLKNFVMAKLHIKLSNNPNPNPNPS